MAVAKKRTRATTVVDFKGLRPYPDEGGITWQSAIVIFIMSIVASLATASAYAVSYQSEVAASPAGASTTHRRHPRRTQAPQLPPPRRPHRGTARG